MTFQTFPALLTQGGVPLGRLSEDRLENHAPHATGITFLLEEWDEQLNHTPIQDLTGRPRYHVMTEASNP